MADNKSISTYLISANAKGYLKPSSEKDICLIDSINSANLILFWLSKAGDNGLNTEQLSQRVKMHKNTCKIFCRELVRLKKVIRELEKTIVIWKIIDKSWITRL